MVEMTEKGVVSELEGSCLLGVGDLVGKETRPGPCQACLRSYNLILHFNKEETGVLDRDCLPSEIHR